MRKKSQETFSITNEQQEKEKTLEKKKSPETELQKEQKERPAKIERNISQYVKNLEVRADKVEKFLDAQKSAQHGVDVAKARTDIPDRGHEKQKKKDYQSYEKEFEKRKKDIDTQVEDLKKQEQELARLYKEGPRDAREALAIQRDRKGEKQPSGVLGKLGDRLLLVAQGHAIKKEVYALLQREKREMRDSETPNRILDIQDKMTDLKKEKEGLFLPETYKAEVEKIKEEERDFFLKHAEENSPKLAVFLKMDRDAVLEKLKDASFKDSDIFSLIKDIGEAQAELVKRHQAVDKALERTRSGYLSTQKGKDIPKTDRFLDKHLESILAAAQKTFRDRMFHSRPKKMDNADLRYVTDKDIKKIAKTEENISKLDERFVENKEKIQAELTEGREKAKIEAERAQHEVIFHTTQKDSFLKILDTKLYSMRALRAAHPEKAAVAETTSHEDRFIFFQPEFPASAYGVVEGQRNFQICGFATVEGVIMKSALTTDTGSNPGRKEVAVIGRDGAPTAIEPDAFVIYMPESVWKKAKPIMTEKYKDTPLPEIIVYPDSLVKDHTMEAAQEASKEIARLVKERVQEVQKRGGFYVEPGGIRTTSDGYRYYSEDSKAW